MKKEDLYYDSRDEITKIHALRWIPDGKPKAILQIIHGMQEYAGRYDEFATYMAERGYLVIANDHLGHGQSVKGDSYGYFCAHDPACVAVRDVHRLKKMTQQDYPNIPIILLGHSMGSFILRNYLFMYGTGIQGAVIVGTGMQPGYVLMTGKCICKLLKLFGRERKPSKYIEKNGFGSYCKRIENPRTPLDWLSVSEENVDAYMADDLCGKPFTVNGYNTLFTLIARAQKKKSIANMRKDLPILMLSGDEDPVGHYGSDPKRLYGMFQKAGVEKVDLHLYPKGRHEILNDNGHESIFEEVYNWIEAVTMRQ